MKPLVMETDIGRDADDLFALLYLLGINAPLRAICVSPGDHDQVAVVKAVLHVFGRSEVKVLTPAARVPKESISPYHKWVIGELGGKLMAEPDGHEESLPAEPVEVFICGPAKMAHLLKPIRITFQGGFVPYSKFRPLNVKALDKFEGKEACATFNLGGTKPKVVESLLTANCPHRWVGKNVCHTVVYTPEVHERFRSPMFHSEAERLHSLFVSKYIEEKGAKAFHDPLAAMLHYNPEVGIWMPLKPERIKGEYTAVEAPEEQHRSLVDLNLTLLNPWSDKVDVQPWARYFDGLQGRSVGMARSAL